MEVYFQENVKTCTNHPTEKDVGLRKCDKIADRNVDGSVKSHS